MTIDVSVILPVYNGENTIATTLDSILHQTIQNIEILIINDGSTDGTEKILNDYKSKDDRIKVFNQKNMGVSTARNQGLKLATGNYVSFLDADDLYDRFFLEKMLSAIKINSNEICYCGVNFYPQGNNSKLKYIFTDKNVLLNYIKGKLPIHTSTWIIDRNLIISNQLYFRENVSWGEDLEFFYRVVSFSKKITFVPEYLTYYRCNHSSDQLSSFSLDKIDLDYEFIKRIAEDKMINSNRKINDALVNYRLSTLIINRLLIAINLGYDKDEIKYYYMKYKESFERFEWTNGLRSLQTNIKKVKVKFLLRKFN